MRILTLLVAAVIAVTMQFTPSPIGAGFGIGAAHAAPSKAERQEARRKAALRRMRRKAQSKSKKARKTVRRSTRKKVRRKVRRTTARRTTARRTTARRTAARRSANRTTVRARPRKKVARVSRRRIVPAQYRRRSVFIKTNEKPGTIIVDTDKKYLYLVRSSRRAIRYGIGVGREGFGWGGTVKVARKAKWPSWTPPKEMIEREWRQNRRKVGFMEGGPRNPMGARALYLHKRSAGDTGYRIHGTNEPWSIGLAMSSGCVRMLNKDVEHLYDRVRVGSKVIVIGPGGPRKRGTYATGLFSLL